MIKYVLINLILKLIQRISTVNLLKVKLLLIKIIKLKEYKDRVLLKIQRVLGLCKINILKIQIV